MKISVLAFAPLGLVALLAMVSADPTDPTANAGAIAKDFITQMTLGQVYLMVNDTVNEVQSIFDNTATKEFTVTRVYEMFELARTKVIFWEKDRVEKLDESSSAKNEISFSELLDGCISESNVKVKEIYATLVAGFHNNPIPRGLFKGGLKWAYLQVKLKILIKDYTTIKGYFIRKYGQEYVDVDKCVEFGNGIVDSFDRISNYLRNFNANGHWEVGDTDLKAMTMFIAQLKSEDIADPHNMYHWTK
ncbi:hypothetical protein IWQ61_003070 [Dispira simplex]|nr:hypothetical protein IWQ61_003070 [Dispira simplex]